MASDTDTAKADRGDPISEEKRPPRRYRLPGSRLGRLIIVLNVLGLSVLIAGALVLNELRQGLVNARIDSLSTQGELMASIIDRAATVGEPEPGMDAAFANELVLQLLANPKAQRARLYDARGKVVADSEWVFDRVDSRQLSPAKARTEERLNLDLRMPSGPADRPAKARAALAMEVNKALRGQHVAGVRRGEDGVRVVSVSIPIQHVQAVLGVLTLEARDVDEIVARERMALIPFILIAIGVTLGSSLLLTRLIATPVRRLSRAADSVRLSRARAISLSPTPTCSKLASKLLEPVVN